MRHPTTFFYIKDGMVYEVTDATCHILLHYHICTDYHGSHRAICHQYDLANAEHPMVQYQL